MTDSSASVPNGGSPYRVLARKYRPARFNELIGQEAMVRTLGNAIATGRLAHAFILTGVRGVGKTTTARIIARALNCIGPDGRGGPTVEPCGVCENCIAIAGDRHVDVIEMDAASRTGVDDIRELIEGVRYRPVMGRYKVYIVDEVHMLTKNAFNALLKTLEEPPSQVKFVFATTEIRKVPVTVLSRCQRFDLRRVEAAELIGHLAGIAQREGARVAPEALALIARAADGSVRDGLSLLDQAIAHSGAGEIDTRAVQDMLGLADRVQLFDLFELLLKGDAAAALDLFAGMYGAGADPIALLQDLLDLTHWLTRLKIVPNAPDAALMPEAERVKGGDMAGRLSMGVLTRAWQMLLKGLGEANQAPAPKVAVEMLFVRLAYAADLPTPAELVAAIKSGAAPAPTAVPATTPALARPAVASAPGPAPPRGAGSGGWSAPQPDMPPEPVAADAAPSIVLESFRQVVALFEARRLASLHGHLVNNVHLVGFRPGHVAIRPTGRAPANLAADMAAQLTRATGARWIVSVSGEPGEATLAEQAATKTLALRREAESHPLVRAALDAFPGATIQRVHGPGAESPDDAPPPEPDDDEA
ncbi:MAG: DNA polymerase III subunit gamma/tau [Alphaproteobacteria bacterium]|nr:DNA polymerase III subunit gamma/tau [Alphaproteobacteria bacterium]